MGIAVKVFKTFFCGHKNFSSCSISAEDVAIFAIKIKSLSDLLYRKLSLDAIFCRPTHAISSLNPRDD